MTVATTVFFLSSSSRIIRSAHMAMSTSPSTICPRSSTTMTRSASPSSATPMAAPRFTTSARTFSGWSAPESLLMLMPFGFTPMAVTWAPSSWSTIGATLYAAPCAASTTIRTPSSERSCGNVCFKIDDVAGARILEFLGAADGGAGVARAEERVVGHQALDLGLHRVGELEAVRPEDLDAVVLIRVVARADDDAGVGAHAHRQIGDGGRRHRSAQDHAAPHGANARRDRRFEHVTGEARVFADDDARACALPRAATNVTARPRASASSGVIGCSFATPRMPSVPNRRRTCAGFSAAALLDFRTLAPRLLLSRAC